MLMFWFYKSKYYSNQTSECWWYVAVRGAERHPPNGAVTDSDAFQTQFTPPAANIFSSGLFLVLKHQMWCLFTSALCLTQSFSVHKWTSKQQTPLEQTSSNRHRNAHIWSFCEVRQWTLQKHTYQCYTFCFRHPANLHRSF